MADLRLAKLPDRSPVKITIILSPALSQDLVAYATAYEAAYGEREAVADLIPFMLEQYLASDRAFSRSRNSKAREG